MLPAIDWKRPWFASIESDVDTIIDQADWRSVLNQQCSIKAISNHRGLPLRFVEQTELPEGIAYEAFISATVKIPTRNNLHDFFNAMAWLSFPNVKRQLNALQAMQIANAGVSASRGPVRDAATIFDENSALLVVSDTMQGLQIIEWVREHCWQRIFLEQRGLFDTHAEVWLFGHALMEKLVTPYKAITAHAWPVIAPISFFAMSHDEKRAWLDTEVSCDLRQQAMQAATFMPLPVLGVPGWWQSQDEAFYADASVFRPKSRRGVVASTER